MFKVSRFYCLVLTTVFSFPVVPNHYPLVGCAEQCCPVDGVIIAQIAVVSDVDVPRMISFKDWNCRDVMPCCLRISKERPLKRGRGKNETVVIVFWP